MKNDTWVLTSKTNTWLMKNFCDVCNCRVNFKDEFSKQQHIKGKKHQTRLNIKNKKEKDEEIFKTLEEQKIVSTKNDDYRFPHGEDIPGTTVFNVSNKPKRVVNGFKVYLQEVPLNIRSCFEEIPENRTFLFEFVMKQCPKSIKMLDDDRFYRLLDEFLLDNLMELLYYLLLPDSTKVDVLETFYNHDDMRIYFAELVSSLFNIPFCIKFKMYRLPRNYNIKIFSQLFNIYSQSKKVNVELVCDKIDKIYRYYTLSKQIEEGEFTQARSIIVDNAHNRNHFLESTYLEAKGMWDPDIAAREA